jgi:hypothetical protein
MRKGWGLVAILVAAGAVLLRWALGPAYVSFSVGREIGRMEGARKAATGGGEPLPPLEP